LTIRLMADLVRHQDPLVLRPSTTVREACRHMHERRVGAVLVVANDDDRVVGIFTGRDAVHRVLAERESAASCGSFQRAFELPAASTATRSPPTFSKGVLTIDMPKTAEAQQQPKKIEVRHSCAGRSARLWDTQVGATSCDGECD
jgi:CBS domain-containing protein